MTAKAAGFPLANRKFAEQGATERDHRSKHPVRLAP